MAFHKETADAWIKAFAISLLMYGASAVITGIISLLVSIIAPVSAFADWPEKIAAIFVSVFTLVLGPFIMFWGWAMLKRQTWTRILTIVFSYLGALLGLLMIVGGIALLAMPDLIPEFPGASSLLGALLLVVAVIVLAFSALSIWLFQVEPTIDALFAKQVDFVLDTLMAASLVRAWALLTWLSAVSLAIFVAVFLLISPFLGKILVDVLQVTTGEVAAVVGIIALIGAILAVLLHFISKGLWNFRNWARIVTIIFAVFWAVFYIVNLGVVIFSGENVVTIGDAVSATLYAIGISIVQIWFFTSDLTKPLFSVGEPTSQPTGQPRRTVKKK
jgi:hypothetical protein